jgi:hypothetical protein
MKYIYYIDGEKFTTNNISDVAWDDISSPDENTPAYNNISEVYKVWCKKGRKCHRLRGPAQIFSDGTTWFCLYGKFYFKNIHSWLEDHPNQDNAFQVEMLLKYS